MGDNKAPLSKLLFKNLSFNLLEKVVSKVLSLVFMIVLARALQPELFGTYSLVISVVGIFLTFADLGINAALIRYVSANVKKKEKAAEYMSYLLKLKLILSFGISLLLILISKPLAVYVFHNPQLSFLFIISAIFLLTMSLIDFFSSLFYSFNKFIYFPIKETIFQGTRIILLFVVIFFLTKTVANVLWSLIAANIVVLAFVLSIVKKNYSFLFKGKTKLSKENRKGILLYIFYLTISNLSVAFFSYIDTIMLGIFVDPIYVGFYRAAYSTAAAISGLMGITSVLFPVFSQLGKKRSEYTFKKIFHYSALLSFPAAFGLAIISSPFIGLLYGKEYLPSVLPLYILSSLVITSTVNLYPAFLTAKEKPKWPAQMMVLSTILNVILNYVLIKLFLSISPLYATFGAAAATSASNFFFYFSLLIISKKKLKLKIDSSSVYKPLIASVVMSIFLLLFNYFFGLIWPIVLIELILGAIIYFVTMILIKGIKQEDFDLIKRLIKH
jgi:stage V sporulation protein B